MFYDKYLTEKEKELLRENYLYVLDNIDNDNALKIIDILEKNSCNFINDLIINYLEIFLQKPNIIQTKLNIIKNDFSNNYMSIIENNLNLLVD